MEEAAHKKEPKPMKVKMQPCDVGLFPVPEASVGRARLCSSKQKTISGALAGPREWWASVSNDFSICRDPSHPRFLPPVPPEDGGSLYAVDILRRLKQ